MGQGGVLKNRQIRILDLGAFWFSIALFFATFCFSAVGSQSVIAPAGKSTIQKKNSVDSVKVDRVSDKSDTSGTRYTLGTSATHFLGTGASRGESQPFYYALEAAVKSNSTVFGIPYRLDAFGLMSLNQTNFRFYEFKESAVYAGPVAIGRKPVVWTEVDDQWGLGLWSSRFRWDYLAPETIPLTGLTYSQDLGRRSRFHFFTSYLFIPERGAPLDFSEGRIQSNSEWVLSPPDSTAIRGVETPVRYGLRTDRVSDILFNPSVSASYAMDRGEGFVFRSSAAYKPINQVMLGYEAALTNGLSEVDVTLYPRVAYHRVFGADLGYQNRLHRTTFSVVSDQVTDKKNASPSGVRNFTYQQPSGVTLVSAATRVFLSSGLASDTYESFKNKASFIELGYLQRFGSSLPDQGFYSDGTTHFESRIPFSRMALVGLDTNQSLDLWRLQFRVRGDIENPGTILSWRVERWITAKRIGYGFVSADFLTRFGDTQNKGGANDFIGRYQSNDRFQGGVRFVF